MRCWIVSAPFLILKADLSIQTDVLTLDGASGHAIAAALRLSNLQIHMRQMVCCHKAILEPGTETAIG